MNRSVSSPRKAYGETLIELGHQYSDVTVLDADLSSSTHTRLFAEKFAQGINTAPFRYELPEDPARKFVTEMKVVSQSASRLLGDGSKGS